MSLFNKLTKNEREQEEKYALQQVSLGESMGRLIRNEDFKKVFIDYRSDWLKIVYKQLTDAVMNKDEEAIRELEDTLRWLKGIDKYIEYIGNYNKIGLDTIEALKSEVNYAD